MRVKVSRLCSVWKAKWRNGIFFTKILQRQEPEMHASHKDGQAKAVLEYGAWDSYSGGD